MQQTIDMDSLLDQKELEETMALQRQQQQQQPQQQQQQLANEEEDFRFGDYEPITTHPGTEKLEVITVSLGLVGYLVVLPLLVFLRRHVCHARKNSSASSSKNSQTHKATSTTTKSLASSIPHSTGNLCSQSHSTLPTSNVTMSPLRHNRSGFGRLRDEPDEDDLVEVDLGIEMVRARTGQSGGTHVISLKPPSIFQQIKAKTRGSGYRNPSILLWDNLQQEELAPTGSPRGEKKDDSITAVDPSWDASLTRTSAFSDRDSVQSRCQSFWSSVLEHSLSLERMINGRSWQQRQQQQLRSFTLQTMIQEERQRTELARRPKRVAVTDRLLDKEQDSNAAVADPTIHRNGRLHDEEDEEEGTGAYLASIFSLWDAEGLLLCRLACEHACTPLLQGILRLLTCVIIGLGLGTSDLMAYLIVTYFVGWTTRSLSSVLFGSLHLVVEEERTRTVSSSASIASVNTSTVGDTGIMATKIGEYTQITLFLLVAFSMPLWILWTMSMDNLFQWLDMDERTTTLGIGYTYIVLVLALMQGISDTVHSLFVRVQRVSYSTVTTLLEEILGLIAIGIWASVAKADLLTFGLVQLQVAVTFLVSNVGVALYQEWLEEYQKGLLGSCALSVRQTCIVPILEKLYTRQKHSMLLLFSLRQMIW